MSQKKNKNARAKKVKARLAAQRNQANRVSVRQPQRSSFGKETVADLEAQFKIEDNMLQEMDFDKLGVMAVFHHSDGGTNTLRVLGAKSDAIEAAGELDKNDTLGFLCDMSRKNNLINNQKAAMCLMSYAAQSQTFDMANMMYDNAGLIMNFYLKGEKYSCRDCNALDFDKWVLMSREMQKTGGVNQFYAEAV